MAKRVGKHVFGESHRTIRGGGWYGNKTLWRMVHDINRALVYADGFGRLHPSVTKGRFCIVDGIIAGEGMGPTGADPVACGVIVAGHNPVAVDVASTELIGFDHTRIPMLAEAFLEHSLPLVRFGVGDIRIASNDAAWSGSIETLRQANPFSFGAPLGWIDYVERTVSHPESHGVRAVSSTASASDRGVEGLR